MTKLPTGRHTQTIKSTKKNKERELANKSIRSRAKTFIRKVREAVDNGDITEAQKTLPLASKYIDTAVAKGAFHKNKASRLKSRLTKKIKKTTP
jgi:small subunit ribosomal protein S20